MKEFECGTFVFEPMETGLGQWSYGYDHCSKERWEGREGRGNQFDVTSATYAAEVCPKCGAPRLK
jgi:hypothetical protein